MVLYPEIVPTKSLEEALRDDEIQLVIVNTPDDTHYEFAKKCLEAGKHIVVEKPFTQTVEQAEELIRIAARSKKVLSVYHNRRWDGDFQTVQKIIREKTLGRVVEYAARWDRYLSSPRLNTWKEQPERGAGMLTDLGSHLIDQALVLFGVPEAVSSHLNTVRPGSTIVDWFVVRLHYAGTNVEVRGSFLAREPSPRYVLHGTQGSFIKHGVDPQEDDLQHGKKLSDPGWGIEPASSWGFLHTEHDGKSVKKKIETLPGNYGGYYENIADCINHGTGPAVKPEESLLLMNIIAAAKRSHELKKTIALQVPGPE